LTLDRRREPPELIISKIMPIETAASDLARGLVVRLHKGVHQEQDLERLLRFVRVRPGHLDLYLEVLGIENVKRAIYRAGASLRIRYEESLMADLEQVVGPGNVRLLGQKGATVRFEASTPAPQATQAIVSDAADIDLEESAIGSDDD